MDPNARAIRLSSSSVDGLKGRRISIVVLNGRDIININNKSIRRIFASLGNLIGIRFARRFVNTRKNGFSVKWDNTIAHPFIDVLPYDYEKQEAYKVVTALSPQCTIDELFHSVCMGYCKILALGHDQLEDELREQMEMLIYQFD